MKTMHLIHYGCPHWVPSHFVFPENLPTFVKPKGGLWASPVDSNYGWKEWCEAEDFHTESLKHWFVFEYTGRIMTIDTRKDLEKMCFRQMRLYPNRRGIPQMIQDLRFPDFEKLSKKIDAIYLTEAGQWKTRMMMGPNLYGWDCECVLILNPAGVIRELGSSADET